MRLIQFIADNGTQHVGGVAADGRSVRAVGGFVSSYELAQAAFRFLPARARLDVAGWPEVDIFAH